MEPLLTKDQILKAPPTRTFEDVRIDSWGGTVRVAKMSATQSMEFEAIVSTLNGDDPAKNAKRQSAELLVRVIVGEDFKPLLTLQDIEALLARTEWEALAPIMKAAQRLAEVESEEKKDSGDPPSSGSSSDSPVPAAGLSAGP